MNALRNRVQLIGHLGNDPQVKSFDNGNKVVKLTVATNSTYNNKAGERVQDTQWHNVVMWGKTAEIAEKYLQKGQEVAIEGKLTTRSSSISSFFPIEQEAFRPDYIGRRAFFI